MEFLNHQDLGPLFTLKSRNKGRKEQQQYYLKHRPISKDENMLLLTQALIQTMSFLSVKFPNIRSKYKDILNTSAPARCPDASTDRASIS